MLLATTSNTIGKRSATKLADGVEQAVTEDDTGQIDAAQSRNVVQQRQHNAQVFSAEIETGVGNPGDPEDPSLTGR